jgi:hypothetical protein
MMPNAESSHKITQIITTAFKIVLIEPAIGTYVLINQSKNPITTNTIMMVIIDIFKILFK